MAMVGPAALGVSTSQLRKTAVNGARVGSWPTDFHPWSSGGWIPNAPYIYNNDPNNHGGYVPAGGMVIDGFNIPAGVWVSQFNDFDGSMIINGNSNGQSPDFPGIVYRGCRWRGPNTAPGYLNIYQNSNTNVWVLFSDAGGLGAAANQFNETPFSTGDGNSNTVFYRNYISYTSTGIQPGNRGPQVIENYIEKMTLYNPDLHLNGISFNGGQKNALVLRNKVLVQNPDDAGRTISQTDAIAFFQDFGDYQGTGTNLDGSVGYKVKDNYIGGGGYSLYAGMNSGKTATSVKNMVVTGNQVTTQWWPNGGMWGPVTAEAVWGSYGNVALDNIWADGPKAGTLAFGSKSVAKFPDATNTGYKNAPGYTGTLTNCTGTVIQSNKTYSFCDFSGDVSVGSRTNPVSNVTFYGCRFHGSGTDSALVLLYGDNITFDYSTFEPNVAAPPVSYTQGYQYGIEGNGGWYTSVQQLTVTRSNFWGFANAIDVTGSTQAKPHVFRDNYLHDARADGGVDHTDGIGQLNGTNAGSHVVLDHNTIVSAGNTNGVAYQTTTCENFTVTNNYFSGFGYTVNICGSGAGNKNLLFAGNTFGTDIKPIWGPMYGWSDGNNNVWKCNKIRFVPGTTWTSGGGWKPVSTDDGKFWLPTSGVSATDYKGNTSCP